MASADSIVPRPAKDTTESIILVVSASVSADSIKLFTSEVGPKSNIESPPNGALRADCTNGTAEAESAVTLFEIVKLEDEDKVENGLFDA